MIRKMSSSDIPAGMRLKEIAGWNQVPADWEAYLQLEPQGCFVAELDEKTVATTTTINYESRFGWIGMVIVDPNARRQGIAGRMLNQAIAFLEAASCRCQKLDATEAGARVYQQVGFAVEYEVERWAGAGLLTSGMVNPPLPALSTADLDRIGGLDGAAFGASRRKLLEWYCSNRGPRFLAGHREKPTGYVAGRPGSGAWQMGPLVAESAEVAKQLMSGFLAELPGEPVIADVPAHNSEAIHLLEGFAFTRQRVLQRMYRGENSAPGRPGLMFGLAGFEYG